MGKNQSDVEKMIISIFDHLAECDSVIFLGFQRGHVKVLRAVHDGSRVGVAVTPVHEFLLSRVDFFNHIIDREVKKSA